MLSFRRPKDFDIADVEIGMDASLSGTIQIERVRHRMMDLWSYEKNKFRASTGGEPNGAASN